MNFVQLVNDVLLKESQDSLSFGGKRLAYDAPRGNPITFFVDYLNYSKGTYEFHKANLGLVVVYSKRNVRVSHTELEDILFNFNYRQLQERELISFFSPDLNVEERLNQLHGKYPTMSITTNLNREDMSDAQLGRMWKLKDKVIITLWENDQKFIEKYEKMYLESIIKLAVPALLALITAALHGSLLCNKLILFKT
jgi:hypothetical protein